MKKLLLICLVMAAATFKVSAQADITCFGPEYLPYQGGAPIGSNRCGYYDPAGAPAGMRYGTYCALNNPTAGCTYYTSASVNGGLIFLIIAGAGLGAFVFSKKGKLKVA